MILVDGDFLADGIVVGAIVCDVQTTVAINEGEVAIAVETAGVTRTQGDEVAVIDVVDGGRGIAEHGIGVGIDLVTTRRHISTSKHSVVDNDTAHIQLFPYCSIGILVLQGVEIFDENILAWCVGMPVDGNVGNWNDIYYRVATSIEHRVARTV